MKTNLLKFNFLNGFLFLVLMEVRDGGEEKVYFWYKLTLPTDADIKKRIMKILKRSEEHGDSVCLPHPKNGADEDEWHLVYCQDADDEDDDKGTDAKDLAGDAVDNWLMELKEYTFAGEDNAANTCEKVPSELAVSF